MTPAPGAALGGTPVRATPGTGRSPILLILLLGVPAGIMGGIGLGGAAAMSVAAGVACLLGLAGEALLFVAITTAISGIGFFWIEGGLQIAGQGINVNGLYWGLLLITSGVLLLRRPPERLPRPFILYGVFLAVSLLGLLWTPSLFEGIRHLGLYALPALMGATVLAYVRCERDARRLVGAFWLALVLAILVAVGITLDRRANFVPGGLTGGVGERTFAIFLLPLLGLAVAAARHRSRWFAGVAVGIALLGLATLSRTAVVIMLVLPLFGTLGSRLRSRAALLGVLILAGVCALQIEAFRERFGTASDLRLGGVEVEGTGGDAALSAGRLNLSGRGWMWLQVGRHAIERPVTGFGTGSATAYMGALPGAPEVHPHNDYLRVFHDLGAIGLLSVLAFGLGSLLYFRRVYLASWRPLTREMALASFMATAAYGMIAVTDNPILYATFFGQNIFVLFALTEIVRRSEPGDARS